jgi:glycosyltransferase involved in cell wall biosynthesis
MDDVEDLTRKIDYWIDHPDELAQFKTLYYESSFKYRIEQSYEKLLSLYYGLIKNRPV